MTYKGFVFGCIVLTFLWYAGIPDLIESIFYWVRVQAVNDAAMYGLPRL